MMLTRVSLFGLLILFGNINAADDDGTPDCQKNVCVSGTATREELTANDDFFRVTGEGENAQISLPHGIPPGTTRFVHFYSRTHEDPTLRAMTGQLGNISDMLTAYRKTPNRIESRMMNMLFRQPNVTDQSPREDAVPMGFSGTIEFKDPPPNASEFDVVMTMAPNSEAIVPDVSMILHIKRDNGESSMSTTAAPELTTSATIEAQREAAGCGNWSRCIEGTIRRVFLRCWPGRFCKKFGDGPNSTLIIPHGIPTGRKQVVCYLRYKKKGSETYTNFLISDSTGRLRNIVQSFRKQPYRIEAQVLSMLFQQADLDDESPREDVVPVERSGLFTFNRLPPTPEFRIHVEIKDESGNGAPILAIILDMVARNSSQEETTMSSTAAPQPTTSAPTEETTSMSESGPESTPEPDPQTTSQPEDQTESGTETGSKHRMTAEEIAECKKRFCIIGKLIRTTLKTRPNNLVEVTGEGPNATLTLPHGLPFELKKYVYFYTRWPDGVLKYYGGSYGNIGVELMTKRTHPVWIETQVLNMLFQQSEPYDETLREDKVAMEIKGVFAFDRKPRLPDNFEFEITIRDNETLQNPDLVMVLKVVPETTSDGATSEHQTGSGNVTTSAAPTESENGETTSEVPTGGGSGTTSEAPTGSENGETTSEAPTESGNGETTSEVPTGGGGGTTSEAPTESGNGETTSEVPTGGGGGTTLEAPTESENGETTSEASTGGGSGTTSEAPTESENGETTSEVPTGGGGGTTLEAPTESENGETTSEASTGGGSGTTSEAPTESENGETTSEVPTGGGGGTTLEAPTESENGETTSEASTGGGSGTTSEAPTESKNGETTSEVPTEGGSGTTLETPIESGSETTSEAPTESENGETTSEASTASGSESPLETQTEGGSETTSEAPTEGGSASTSETPIESGSETTSETSTASGSESTLETQTEGGSETTSETPIESGSETTSEAPTESENGETTLEASTASGSESPLETQTEGGSETTSEARTGSENETTSGTQIGGRSDTTQRDSQTTPQPEGPTESGTVTEAQHELTDREKAGCGNWSRCIEGTIRRVFLRCWPGRFCKKFGDGPNSTLIIPHGIPTGRKKVVCYLRYKKKGSETYTNFLISDSTGRLRNIVQSFRKQPYRIEAQVLSMLFQQADLDDESPREDVVPVERSGLFTFNRLPPTPEFRIHVEIKDESGNGAPILAIILDMVARNSSQDETTMSSTAAPQPTTSAPTEETTSMSESGPESTPEPDPQTTSQPEDQTESGTETGSKHQMTAEEIAECKKRFCIIGKLIRTTLKTRPNNLVEVTGEGPNATLTLPHGLPFELKKYVHFYTRWPDGVLKYYGGSYGNIGVELMTKRTHPVWIETQVLNMLFQQSEPYDETLREDKVAMEIKGVFAFDRKPRLPDNFEFEITIRDNETLQNPDLVMVLKVVPETTSDGATSEHQTGSGNVTTSAAPTESENGETTSEVPTGSGSGTTSEAPTGSENGETTSEAPTESGNGETTSEVPTGGGSGTTSEAPTGSENGETASEAPTESKNGETTSEVPTEGGSGTTLETPIESGSETTSEAPTESENGETTSEASTASGSESPLETQTEGGSETTSETPIESGSETTSETSTASGSETTSETSTASGSESTLETQTEGGSGTTSEAPTESKTETTSVSPTESLPYPEPSPDQVGKIPCHYYNWLRTFGWSNPNISHYYDWLLKNGCLTGWKYEIVPVNLPTTPAPRPQPALLPAPGSIQEKEPRNPNCYYHKWVRGFASANPTVREYFNWLLKNRCFAGISYSITGLSSGWNNTGNAKDLPESFIYQGTNSRCHYFNWLRNFGWSNPSDTDYYNWLLKNHCLVGGNYPIIPVNLPTTPAPEPQSAPERQPALVPVPGVIQGIAPVGQNCLYSAWLKQFKSSNPTVDDYYKWLVDSNCIAGAEYASLGVSSDQKASEIKEKYADVTARPVPTPVPVPKRIAGKSPANPECNYMQWLRKYGYSNPTANAYYDWQVAHGCISGASYAFGGMKSAGQSSGNFAGGAAASGSISS